MKKLLLICFCFLSTSVYALEAHLVPNPILWGESTELVISSDKPLTTPENLKELTQTFMIAGQQQRQSSHFVNGVGSTTYELAFVLFPLRLGEIHVPSLKVGTEETSPLTLNVLEKKQENIPAKEQAKNMPVLELSANVSEHVPYVGQTIFYTLTLTDGQGVLDGEIIPAKIEGAKLAQMGQDKVASVLKDGQRVREIERTYALTLDRAGKIEIPPALFNGQVAYQATRPANKRKFFGIADAGLLFDSFFNTERPVSLTSNPVTIDVQPKPVDFKGWWLPSSKVELNIENQIPTIVQVGDTLSAKLILTAQDVSASDMPVPRFHESKDFRLYPQPEERTTTIQNGHLIGKVSVPFMLVPLKAGEIQFPQASVEWFNTQTKTVIGTAINRMALKVEQGAVAPPKVSSAPESKEELSAKVPQKQEPSEGWIWAVGGVVLGLALGALSVFIWHYKKTHKKGEKEKPLPDFYAFK